MTGTRTSYIEENQREKGKYNTGPRRDVGDPGNMKMKKCLATKARCSFFCTPARSDATIDVATEKRVNEVPPSLSLMDFNLFRHRYYDGCR